MALSPHADATSHPLCAPTWADAVADSGLDWGGSHTRRGRLGTLQGSVGHRSGNDPLRGRGISRHAGCTGLVAFLLIAASITAAQSEIIRPDCEIRHPPGSERAAERLRQWFPKSRRTAAVWLGLPPRGTPILELVDGIDRMRAVAGPFVPEWAAAVCLSNDHIVFRLDVVDSRPAKKLELVLDHEVVHQFLNHLGGPRLPRWFEEGLCVTFAGLPFVESNFDLQRSAAAGRLPTFEETRLLFRGNATQAAAAYEVGHQAVRHLIEHYGHQALRDILRRVGNKQTFEQAWRTTTGQSVEAFEEAWRKEITPPLPFWLYVLVSDFGLTMLWFAALLVFVGWVVRRMRREREMRSLETDRRPPDWE